MKYMKKIRQFLFVLLVCMSSITAFSFADIIMPNTHYVDRCVKIQENPEITGIALKAKITWPMVQWDKEDYDIKYDTCLHKWYKFNTLNIILQKDGQEYDLWELESWGWYVDDKYSVTNELLIYQVKKYDNVYRKEMIYNEEWSKKILLDRKNDVYEISERDYDKFWYKDIILRLDKDFFVPFFLALFLTIVIETLVLLIMVKCFPKYFAEMAKSWNKIIFSWILCSLTTLSYFWIVMEYFHQYLHGAYPKIMVLCWEWCVFLIEAVILKYIFNISRKKALLLSFVANAVSFGLWLLCFEKILNFFLY